MLMSSMLMSIGVDGSPTEYFNIFEYYLNKFAELVVDPMIFMQFTGVLILLYLIRYQMIIYIEKQKGFKNDKDRRYKEMYTIGHMAIEIFIAFVVCYTVIKLTNANPDSYLINILVAPMFGFLIGIVLDIKMIMPLEDGMEIGVKKDKSKKDKRDKKSLFGGSPNNINVTVNNGSTDPKPVQSVPVIPIGDFEPLPVEKIDEDTLNDGEEFDSVALKAINGIIDVQADHTKKIDENTERLDDIIKCIDNLRESDMIDKQIALKSMIYGCLNNGFATPEENDKITKLYYAYHVLLKGNHEVESLYENHYLKLEVHEDRRKSNVPVETEKRKSKNKIPYGSFDNEEKKE